jgi:glycosyltransferase involved in cell wall biosynthesis
MREADMREADMKETGIKRAKAREASMIDTKVATVRTDPDDIGNVWGEPLRVALIAECGEKGGNMGGAERQAYYIIRALADAGVQVKMFSVTDNNTAYMDALNTMRVETRHFGWMPVWPLRLMLLLSWLRKFRPHVVQSVHNFTNAYSALAGRALGVVSVGGLRSDLQSCLSDNGRYGRFLLTGPDAIAVNSRTAVADVIHSGILTPARVHLLPNVIDTRGFEEPAATAATDGDCLCITVARLVPRKRIDLFLRALKAARRTEPRLRGAVVGCGPESARLEQVAAELGLLPDAVQFLGPREDIADLLRKSSMFVFCSESEGTPNVILEAMAAGLPVITTPAGDAAEMVGAAGAGRVVPFGDVPAISAAMIEMARSPQACAGLGEAGRAYIARNCDASTLGTRLLQLYSDVARTSRRNRRDLLQRLEQYSQQI